MTNQERKKRLNELINACEKRIEKLNKEIEQIWDHKKNKPKKGKEEELKELKQDQKEWEIVLDTYRFIEYELDI